MPFNRGYIACYSNPASAVKNLKIGLSKRTKKKWKKGKKTLNKTKVAGLRSLARFPLHKKKKNGKGKKKYKKKKVVNGGKKGSKKKKKVNFQMLLNKGKSFGVPSTIKQIN
jgi:hypothetical protein